MFSDKKKLTDQDHNKDYECFDLSVEAEDQQDKRSYASPKMNEEPFYALEESQEANLSFEGLFDQNKDHFLTCLNQAEVNQARFIQQLNANLEHVMPNVSLAPWAMVPGSVWKSQAAPLLFLKCRLLPTDKWNMFLMPADFDSACTLNMPVHPGAEASVLNDAFTDFLMDLDAEFKGPFDQLLAGKSLAMLRSEETFSSVVNQVKARIIHQARKLTASYFGESVFERHEELFGPHLGQR